MRLLWFFSIRFFLFAFFLIFAFSSFANKSCDGGFVGSRLYYDNKVLKKRAESVPLHPQFVNIMAEKALQKKWNEKPDTPVLLETLFPKDVHFIKHQLYQPGEATVVKMSEWGEALMVRAHYKHGERMFHTNVVFSTRALLDNMNDGARQNWLVGKNARAAILYLHGGGTRTTGSHVARVMTTHFRKYDIDVISVDLPWHAQGHREFLDLETDIKVLGSFVRKYVPPNVPLFVGGHSWGSVFAEQLMRMTDRPHEEFLFHPNLKGVVILSTAVDYAPGKSREEKYKIYREKLLESKKRLKMEAPEHEKYIFEGIVQNGKTSPLGAFYAMRIILELDQSTPEHKGRKYVPALMAVGTKDALVYLGFEKLYEVYKELENVESHYLDALLPYMAGEKEPYSLRPVGHLLGDYATKDPSTKEPIPYFLIRNFIERQLALSSLKTGVSKTVQSSSLKEADKALIVERLDELKSFDEIRDFLDKDTRIQSLDSQSLDHINNRFDIELRTPSFSKEKTHKKDMPAFVRLVQLVANDLSFREFLQEYRYYDEQKTATYISYREKKRPGNVQKIAQVLANYNTPLKRIKHFFSRLLKVEGVADLEPLYAEVQFITENYSKQIGNKRIKEVLIALREQISSGSEEGLPNIREMAGQILEGHQSYFDNKSAKQGEAKSTKPQKINLVQRIRHLLDKSLNVKDIADLEPLYAEVQMITDNYFKKISNRKIENALVALGEQMKEQLSSGSEEGLPNIREMAGQVLEGHQSYFDSSSSNRQRKTDSTDSAQTKPKRNLISGLVAVLLASKDLNQVKEIVKSHQLPESVAEKVTTLMERYFIIENMVEFKYLPETSDVLKRGLSFKRKNKVLSIIRQISDVVKNKEKLFQEILDVKAERKALGELYNKRFQAVQHNIKMFRKTVEKIDVDTQPPPSLVDAYKKSAEELKKTMEAADIMEETLEGISARIMDKGGLSDSQIADLLKPERTLIDDFTDMYLKYIQNRQLLQQKLVVAGENGEMGEEFKNVVISLYGRGSKGKSSVVGPDNIYSDLEKVTSELALVEARLHRLNKLQRTNAMEYNSLMNSLQRSVSNGGRLQNTGMNGFIRDASNLLNIVEYPLNRVLSGEYGNSRLNGTHVEEAMDYIGSPDRARIFTEVLRYWTDDLRSKVPSILPTAE